MQIGSFRAKPLSVLEALAHTEFIGHFASVHGVLFLGAPWTDQGYEFVCLPKSGGFDGICQDIRTMPHDPDTILEISEPTLYGRLRAADVLVC
jgi:hypothetical protein